MREPAWWLDEPRREPLNAELSRVAAAGVDARRRDRSNDLARALAHARPVRRVGFLLRLRAGQVPAGRESESELRRREREDLEGYRDCRRRRRGDPARGL